MKYGKNIVFKPEKLHSLNIDKQTVNLIPEAAKILEIGCATGFMGKYLEVKKKNTVIGVEKSHDEFLEAKKVLSKVINGDIEDASVIKSIMKEGSFDVVLASALIQHLRNPLAALKTWRKFLKKDGFLIITGSNITHWTIRKKILFGDFTYEDYGLLDNTHLHFYTPKTFKKLIKDAGYKIVDYKEDYVGGGYPKISIIGHKLFPDLFTYQMVIKAVPI